MLKKIEALLTLSITVLLSIIIGFAIGLLAAALYFIPNYQNTLTFADIGGTLAGVGTIVLAGVAIYTIRSWKKQNNHNYQLEYLNKLSTKLIQYTESTGQIISEFEGSFDKHSEAPKEARMQELYKNAKDAHANFLALSLYFEAIITKPLSESLKLENMTLTDIGHLLYDEDSKRDEKIIIDSLRSNFDDEIDHATRALKKLFSQFIHK